jgi:hypothetical protein
LIKPDSYFRQQAHSDKSRAGFGCICKARCTIWIDCQNGDLSLVTKRSLAGFSPKEESAPAHDFYWRSSVSALAYQRFCNFRFGKIKKDRELHSYKRRRGKYRPIEIGAVVEIPRISILWIRSKPGERSRAHSFMAGEQKF